MKLPSFSNRMKWEPVLGSTYYVVLKPCTFFLTEIAHVTVPRGFFTDLASTPEIAHGVLPPDGRYAQAAVLHDYLCEYLSITVKGKPTSITRRMADDIFKDAMLCLNVPAHEIKILYEGVVTYRILCGLDKPSTTRAKRDLESKWAQENL